MPECNLASELVENGRDFKPFTIEEIIFFIVISITKLHIVIGSPRYYLSSNRLAIKWMSNYRHPM